MGWTAGQDEYLRRHYMTLEYKDIAAAIGKSERAVRSRRYLKLPPVVEQWTNTELDLLRAEYAGKQYSEDIDLDGLAEVLGRHKTNVSRKARELGLTNNARRKKEVPLCRCRMSADQQKRFRSQKTKEWHRNNQHPRGMLGKKHTQQTIAIVAEASRRRWEKMTDDQRAAFQMKMLRRRVEKHGRIAPMQERGTWKAGWREIGSTRKYYRSRWEANYARYLQWLKENGQLLDWQHEPETFWFEEIKRGVRSYLPDFKVTENNGAVVYHEVKGWMDDRSRTIIKRMAKYHPAVKLIVIDAKQYRALQKQLHRLVPGWE